MDSQGEALVDVMSPEGEQVSIPQSQLDDAIKNKGFQQAAPSQAPTNQQAEAEETVNMLNPQGEAVAVPVTQFDQAISQNYRQTSPQEDARAANEDKYGSDSELTKTFMEGMAEPVTLGASTGVERLFGAKGEDIQGRRETNPWTHFAGQTAGLMTGLGAVPLLGMAGEGIASAFGLGGEGAGLINRIGTSATKMGIESLILGAGDQTSRMLSGDQSRNLETVASDIGFTGVLGFILGGAGKGLGELWNASPFAGRLQRVLDALSEKYGSGPEAPPTVGDIPPETPPQEVTGIETIVNPRVNQAIIDSGLNEKIPPEIKAGGLSDNDLARNALQVLSESLEPEGLKAKSMIKQFKADISEALPTVLGREAEDVHALPDLSKLNEGEKIGDALKENITERIKPLGEEFNELKGRYEKAVISKEMKKNIIDTLEQLKDKNQFGISPSSPDMGEINKTIEEVVNLDTAKDLARYQTAIDNRIFKPRKEELYRVASSMKDILRKAEENTVLDAMSTAEDGPELISRYQKVRGDYHEEMGNLQKINERLKLGKTRGYESFNHALDDIDPVQLGKKISRPEDSQLVRDILPNYPKAEEAIKQHRINILMKESTMDTPTGKAINPTLFFKRYDKLEPEVRDLIITPEGRVKLEALRTLWKQMVERVNPPGTGGTIMALMGKNSGMSLGAIAGAILKGGAPGVAILGHIGREVGKVAPETVAASTLKFFGSAEKADAPGFKKMVDFLNSVMKGEALISKTTKNIFKSGAKSTAVVLPPLLWPSEKDREKLDKQVKQLGQMDSEEDEPKRYAEGGEVNNDKDLFQGAGRVSSYLPEVSSAVGEMAGNTAAYLNSLRPTSPDTGLDTPPRPPQSAITAYNRTLDIVQQPLMILQHLHEGTLGVEDLKTFKTVYPSLYRKMSDQLTSNMIDAKTKKQPIPYKTRMGLSLFLGQALDSTLTPNSIKSLQASHATPPAQPQMPSPQGHAHPRGTKALTGSVQQMATQDQKRQVSRWS